MGSLDLAVADVEAGRRKGFTWTGGYKFDIDDPRTMDLLYETMHIRGLDALYVIARTNRTLGEWRVRGSPKDIGYNFGIGAWFDADNGKTYIDDIFIQDYPRDEESAVRMGRKYNQKYILKVDGRTRSYEFIPTGVDPK